MTTICSVIISAAGLWLAALNVEGGGILCIIGVGGLLLSTAKS